MVCCKSSNSITMISVGPKYGQTHECIGSCTSYPIIRARHMTQGPWHKFDSFIWPWSAKRTPTLSISSVWFTRTCRKLQSGKSIMFMPWCNLHSVDSNIVHAWSKYLLPEKHWYDVEVAESCLDSNFFVTSTIFFWE